MILSPVYGISAYIPRISNNNNYCYENNNQQQQQQQKAQKQKAPYTQRPHHRRHTKPDAAELSLHEIP
jgi:hypothetical protein